MLIKNINEVLRLQHSKKQFFGLNFPRGKKLVYQLNTHILYFLDAFRLQSYKAIAVIISQRNPLELFLDHVVCLLD